MNHLATRQVRAAVKEAVKGIEDSKMGGIHKHAIGGLTREQMLQVSQATSAVNRDPTAWANSIANHPARFTGCVTLPSEFGWRCWRWDLVNHRLSSPHQGTVWDGPELRCEAWSEAEAVRGESGIHAHLAPVDWASRLTDEASGGLALLTADGDRLVAYVPVCGIVERFGKYVLGEGGWRCEWAMIRKLRAPTAEIGLQLERAFPEVEVVYE